MSNILNSNRTRVFTRILLVMMITALMCSVFAFAESAEGGDLSGLSNTLSGAMESAWGFLKTIGTPIAAVALAICGVKMLWGNSKSAEEAKAGFFRIAIALAIIWLAPLAVTLVKGWFNDSSKWVE